MNTISEQTALKLAEAMQNIDVQMHRSRAAFINLGKSIDTIAKSIVNKRISELSFKAIKYKHKYVEASLLTRWYWKRKYQKADKELQAFVLENSPIPNVSNDVNLH